MQNWTWKLLVMICLVLVGILLFPLGVIIPASFDNKSMLTFPPETWSLRWYETVLKDPEWRDAVTNSLLVASAATVITLCLFVPAGVALGLTEKPRWLISVFMSPFILPPLVLAMGMYGSLGDLRNTFWALPIAHSVFASPIVVLILRNVTRTISRSSVEAAAIHGAKPRKILSTIVLPEILPAVVASALLTFLLSFNEPIFSLYLSTPWNQTLPVRIWGSLRFDVSPAAAVVGTLSMIFSAAMLVVIIRFVARTLKRVQM